VKRVGKYLTVLLDPVRRGGKCVDHAALVPAFFVSRDRGVAGARSREGIQELGFFPNGYSAGMASHGVVMLKVARATPAELKQWQASRFGY
jgi:hypothetical protein